MTDAQLIEKYLAGDISSFNTLVWRWEKPLFNFIYRYINDLEIAKDITQRTFIRIYKNLCKLKELQKFSSWIYQIAANLCKDELKRIGRNNSISLDDIDDHNNNFIDGSIVKPDDKLKQIELTELISQALQAIPAEQRVVIIMKEYQGLKFIEIAEALGEPLNTVKSRMYYGLNALRKVFERWNITKEVLQYEM